MAAAKLEAEPMAPPFLRQKFEWELLMRAHATRALRFQLRCSRTLKLVLKLLHAAAHAFGSSVAKAASKEEHKDVEIECRFKKIDIA